MYLSYTGLLEPLGQSQVLNYLQRLSNNHTIYLITFEKPGDLQDGEELERLRDQCREYHINWIPLTYHKNPRLLATIYDMARFVLKAYGVIKKEHINVIHCRGYIPTFIGLCLKKLSKVPFIFDMRAFWPDEMVTAGRLKEDSLLYKMLKKLEAKCLKEADHVVTLTKAAEEFLTGKYSSEGMADKITTIPTCVNLDLFSMNGQGQQKEQKSEMVLGSVGTVSGWFKIDWLFSFYKALKQRIPTISLQFVSRDSADFIKSEAEENGVHPSELKIGSCTYQQVPGKMRNMTVGAFFFEPGFSKLGSAPTRMGEFLACGVPCVANSGVGDVAHIINKYKVGVVIDRTDETTLGEAVHELSKLIEDPELAKRCRYAAEDWFSVEKGVQKYDQIYQGLSRN
ncbi:glycosyltransferase [Halalkalibaculum sp. DA384]